MSWQPMPGLTLRNDRVPPEDADRQLATAEAIIARLEDQPGVVLADEVGMGKTFVALAVAASALSSTRRRRPVVVMVPAGVAEKWPREWAVFAERCLPAGHRLRASGAVRHAVDFLRHLDDGPDERKHLIFLTHGALSRKLNDPFVRLAFIRAAFARRRSLATQRRAFPRFAASLLGDWRFTEAVTEALLSSPISKWRAIWNRAHPKRPLDDDPVPFALDIPGDDAAAAGIRAVLEVMPIRWSAQIDDRLKATRRDLNRSLQNAWESSLRRIDQRLPLLILDEAHHVKHANRTARLFANPDAEADAEALQGPLGGLFERMLFLTATPFQLGHHELLQVLRRFEGIAWKTKRDRVAFLARLDELGGCLDRAQASALRLERAWGRLDRALAPVVAAMDDFAPEASQPEELQVALGAAVDAQRAVQDAQAHLRPWVIRHTKGSKETRRRTFGGSAILTGAEPDPIVGLGIDGPATLPFLLAARAQAVAALDGGSEASKSLFAYGLASSFEAYADTRRNRTAARDADEPTPDQTIAQPAPTSPRLAWYLDRIAAALPQDADDGWGTHPKVAAVVQRVKELWTVGEKVVVFCFYVETGRSLRTHISRALRAEVISLGASALRRDPTDERGVMDELERISERLLRADSAGNERMRNEVLVHCASIDGELREAVADITIRFMRTPSFLVRSGGLRPDMSVDDLVSGFHQRDASGRSLGDKVKDLSDALRMQVEEERIAMLDALRRIQTGDIRATSADFDPHEQSDRREMLLPNVRLANGRVERDTRERLMLAFNTPFFPEVLVASAVMAEGVDLHRDCRHVIHHDLDWNPSTLEQRTGRVDRIESKALRSGKPVVVYEPFLAGTHDEKMYRVVKDRERWFGVVMGEQAALDERTTEARSHRIPLPTRLAERLTLDLSLRS